MHGKLMHTAELMHGKLMHSALEIYRQTQKDELWRNTKNIIDNRMLLTILIWLSWINQY